MKKQAIAQAVAPNEQDSPSSLLLTYQFDVVFDDSQVIVVEKSRRIGLSWAIACKAVLVAMASKGQDVWYVGYNRDMAKEFIRDCAFWAKTLGEVTELFGEETLEDPDKDVLNYGISFASGFRITALSSKPNNLRGKQGLVILDEAAFHEQLDALLEAALALLIWGGQVIIISTHYGVDNPFNQLCEDIKAGKYPYARYRITFDEAVKAGLYKRICQMKSVEWSRETQAEWVESIYKLYGDKADEELRVIPSNSGGNWLSRVVIEKNMCKTTPILNLTKTDDYVDVDEKERELEIAEWCDNNLKPLLKALDPSLKHYVGEDFARSGNLTSISVGAEQPNLDLEVQFILELGKMPYDSQKQIVVMYIMKQLPNFAGAAFDSRGNGDFLAEAAGIEFGRWDEKNQTGLIDKVMFTDKWYRENTAPFKAALEDGTFKKIPKDAGVLEDLRSFKEVNNIPKIQSKTSKEDAKGIKKHADTAISLLLLKHAQHSIFGFAVMPVKATAGKRREADKITQGY